MIGQILKDSVVLEMAVYVKASGLHRSQWRCSSINAAPDDHHVFAFIRKHTSTIAELCVVQPEAP